MSLEPGTVIGSYRITRPVGRGTYSTVYRAEHDGLDTSVAVKVLAENWALDPDARSRFVSEGQLARRVAAPSVLAVHDVGETPSGQPYLVYDLADRGDLALRIERLGQPAPPADLFRIADALADGLAAMHRCGVIHRDIKPENMLINGHGDRPTPTHLLGPSERLVLGDLGLAKDLSLASGLTAASGTDAYRAPEQEQAGAVIDERADVHAATAVIAHAATGSRPSQTSSWANHLDAHELEPRLRAAIDKGLAASPSNRQPSMASWFEEISAALEETTGVVTNTPRIRWWILAAGIATALMVGGVSGRWTSRVDEGSASIRLQADGQLIASAERDGIDVVLLGPEQLRVGEPGRYTARVQPAGTTLVWLTTDRGPLDGSDTLEVIADEEGTVRIEVLAIPPTGRILRVELLTNVAE